MLFYILAFASAIDKAEEQPLKMIFPFNDNIYAEESNTSNSTATPEPTPNDHYPITKYGIISMCGCFVFGVIITIIAIACYRKKAELNVINNDPLLQENTTKNT